MIKARIKTWSGGKYGRCGEYIAIVQPEYFKNGKIKKTDFKVIKTLGTVKKGYHHQCANYSESIAEVIEDFGNDLSIMLYKYEPYVCRWYGEQLVLVGPQSLEDALERDDYKGDARYIDDEIYCYVDDNVLYSSEDELDQYIDKYID